MKPNTVPAFSKVARTCDHFLRLTRSLDTLATDRVSGRRKIDEFVRHEFYVVSVYRCVSNEVSPASSSATDAPLDPVRWTRCIVAANIVMVHFGVFDRK